MSDEWPYKISAVFQPKRLDNLREEAREFIGQRLEWLRCWVVSEEDGGPYVGQWTWTPVGRDFGWTPEEDLDEVRAL